MANNLLPKYFTYAKLFVKLRWIAMLLFLVLIYIVKNLLKVSIQEVPLYLLSFVLLFLNVISLFLVKYVEKKRESISSRRIKQVLHFQISTDLILLTFILHFSGGIENPFIIYYIFHMIIASIILSPIESYLQMCFALLLVGVLSLFECYGIIPHYSLDGFVSHSLFQNSTYIFSTGLIFITTSFIVVFLTTSIVTGARRNEAAYLKANKELIKKDKVKDEYVLRVTHDIKGHIAAIMSCLSLVKTKALGNLNEKQDEFVNRAYVRTEALSTFAKELLVLTKRRLVNVYVMHELPMKDLIGRVAAHVRVNAESKSIVFNVCVDDDIDTVTGNRLAIEELFYNLLLNAIKYTPEKGKVKLAVKNKDDHIVVEVTDTGIGIPKDDIPKIFDEFFRASNVAKDVKTGTGFGLSIVKQIIDRHKGKIWVESQLGVGSKFIFTLPKKQNTNS